MNFTYNVNDEVLTVNAHSIISNLVEKKHVGDRAFTFIILEFDSTI